MPRDRTTLFCAGFGHRTRAKDLAYEFERFGRLVRCDIPQPKSASSKCFAFIEFEEYRDADDAYDEMQGSRFEGHTLTVQWAKQAPSRAWRYEGRGDRDREPPRRRRSSSRSRSPSRISNRRSRSRSRSPAPRDKDRGGSPRQERGSRSRKDSPRRDSPRRDSPRPGPSDDAPPLADSAELENEEIRREPVDDSGEEANKDRSVDDGPVDERDSDSPPKE
ncbi:hypothetical protein HDU84_003158 [Entophlyctis sp. JEL0112]|nr:hypothetical protein HDU84_003158 [Entophlyctis sp. JEL0112]